MVAPIHGPCGKTASRPGRQTRGSQVLKSLLSGAFLAVVLGAILLVSLSIVAPAPISNVPPETPQTEVPVVAEVPQTEAPEIEAAETDADASAPATVPAVDEPQIETASDVLDTTPLEVPDTASIEGGLVDPEEAEAPNVASSSETPVEPSEPLSSIQTPTLEQDVAVSTVPADPIVVPEPETEQVELTQPETTEDQEITEEPVIVETTDPEPPIIENDTAATEPQDQSIETAEPAPTTDDEPTVTAGVATTSSGLPTGTSGVRVNRIIGSQPEAEAETAAPAEIDPNAPALQRYAATFENPDGTPTVSLVLLDDPALASGADLIRLLPFPVTLVVDSGTPDAISRMTAFRDAGAEVALRAQFPAGALPSDVEVTLQSALEAVPEAVAFVDEGGTGLQSSRDVTNQTIEAMAEDGRGLVIFPKGLNSALRTAQSEGVPAAAIYRDLDGDGQDARVIRRFVDQAAFRARQDGSVILLARLRPETLDALVGWDAANNRGQVVLAPLSAVLAPAAN